MVSFDTIWPADSLEFCPAPGFQDIFVCGTYKLLEDPAQALTEPSAEANGKSKISQSRRGQCLAFRVIPEAKNGYSFQQVQSFDLPAILDMKWSHGSNEDGPILGISDSEGHITLHSWREQSFKKIASIQCASEDTLCLSMDWSDRRTSVTGHGNLVVSLSNGNLCLLSPTEGSNLEVTETWHAHDYEPWIAAWNYFDTNVIYSGGDDLKLKGWDIRQGFAQPAVVNKRFDAGVTSIQSHPHIQHLLAVGSYNNTVQLFDARKLTASVAEVDVGGGAWRVKWHPSETRKHDLLVACMHDGFKVIRFDSASDNDWISGPSQIINHFDEHESMAYGVDWSYDDSLAGEETLVGGCSFYDHKMSLWST
ncbi:Diphthine methyltransferase [Psilocybe cubensis]|uniref:Diphthine methyltransferase n=2 Tax=Psilocybe cubensis TaxID=181762 RepID=A0ACB8HGX9_PSICU|nr:Diphthine methyltransferase [Psilocybe cubensis]KAH9486927.1 Diphthine methyltransferase [Psilocybe cubensis]